MKLAISVLLAIALLASCAAPAEAPLMSNQKKAHNLPQRDRESGNADSHNKNDGATVNEQAASLLQRDPELGNADSHNKKKKNEEEACEIFQEAATKSKQSRLNVLRRCLSRNKKAIFFKCALLGFSCACFSGIALVIQADQQKDALEELTKMMSTAMSMTMNTTMNNDTMDNAMIP